MAICGGEGGRIPSGLVAVVVVGMVCAESALLLRGGWGASLIWCSSVRNSVSVRVPLLVFNISLSRDIHCTWSSPCKKYIYVSLDFSQKRTTVQKANSTHKDKLSSRK